jgi:hypothetical protein
MSITANLLLVEKTYNSCAKRAKARIVSPSPLPDLEILVGIGIAADWIGWAAELSTVKFTGHRRRSDRLQSLIELSRFTYMWAAANALFSRPSILALLGAPANTRGELNSFRILHRTAGILSATETAHLKTLHTILDIPMKVKDFPWLPPGVMPKLFEVIYFKYTTASQQKLGFGKKLVAASAAGTISPVDLPTIIYATRNWHVHGVLLSSSFRGPSQKFELYINTINKALAEILGGVGSHLLTLL